MLLCGERMLPNYRRFSSETGFGEPIVLREALDTGWIWIESDATPSYVAALRDACERQAPDTERFHSLYTSAALDAANVAAFVLDALSQPERTRPCEVAQLGRDTVDLFVQEVRNLDPSSPGFEQAIYRDELM
jgi:uncharacterized protein YjaG (DUF416 family)